MEVRVYPKNFFRYCRLHADQEKTPLFPASVGDIMFPSVFRQGFPSPSWIIPKLEQKKMNEGKQKCEEKKREKQRACKFYPLRLLM